jgi:AcrR family transcriptional regulator
MQERSIKRKQLILATAAHLFARDGFDNVSTRHIAGEAQIPIGSIYQYFPSKLAILEGLRDELLLKQRRLLEVVNFGKYNGDITVFFDNLVEALVIFSADNRMLFQALHSSVSPDAQQVARGVDEVILQRIDQRIKKFRPELDGTTRQLRSQISMQLVRAMLSFSFRQSPEQQKEVIDTLKRLLPQLWADK